MVLFLGRSTCDLTYNLNEYPRENTKVFSTGFIFQPGGPALNAAITFAKLYGSASLLSKIGDNEFGRIIKNKLKDYNVDVFDFSNNENYNIPLSTVFINSGNCSRTIINTPTDEEIVKYDSEKFIKIIDKINPKLLLIDGYELDNKYSIMQYAQKKNIKIILDGGSFRENTIEYLKYVDVAICSQRFQYPGMSLEETIIKLHDAGINKVAFTRDENPIIYSIKGKTGLIDIEKVETADTLGAGDVLHGAFCYYYSNNKDFISSLKSASIDASNSCRTFGTHTWWKNK